MEKELTDAEISYRMNKVLTEHQLLFKLTLSHDVQGLEEYKDSQRANANERTDQYLKAVDKLIDAAKLSGIEHTIAMVKLFL